MADSTDLDVVDGADAGPVSGVPGTKLNNRKGLLIGIVGAVVLLLIAAGVYLFRGMPSLGGDPIKAYRAVMDERPGFKCQDDNPGNFERRSSFEFDDVDDEGTSGGWVSLIEYEDADAAHEGQMKFSENASRSPGFEEKKIGKIEVVSSLNGEGYVEAQQNQGLLAVRFGRYRFESDGDRDRLDDLVDELGYLEPGAENSDPFRAYVRAMRSSGLTSQTAPGGYARRSCDTNGDFVTECMVFWDREAADNDLKVISKVVSTKKKDDKGGEWKVSRGRGIWWITKWTGQDGEERSFYVVRVYRGNTLIAASAPVAQRKKVDAVMRELTK